MKLLMMIFIILFAGVSLALVAREDAGYILINYGQWKLETTLVLSGLALLLCFAILYFLIRLLAQAGHLPHRARDWRHERQRIKASTALTRGLIQLEEGQWRAAENNLIKFAPSSETPLLYYLAAARAAQKQGAHERRDDYLRLAHQATPAADIAIGLTQAELQLSHQQTEQALASLQRVSALAPQHGHVLHLLMKLYIDLHDWPQLLALLPELRKRKVLSGTEADALESRAHAGRIATLPRSQGVAALHEMWRGAPRRVRGAEEVVVSYIQQLRAFGDESLAETVMREMLKKHWSDELVVLYGLVEGPDPARQLAHAEGWLKHQGNNSALLLTLARLSLRNRLWGKARSYFESSLALGPRAETYQELANLLEQMGEPQAALENYRKGLLMVAAPAQTFTYRISEGSDKALADDRSVSEVEARIPVLLTKE